VRTLIEVHIPTGGGIGLIVPWMDLERMDWDRYLMPLAELVAAAHPSAEWTFTPIPDDVDDKGALLGH
jgi:hypothetical protein